MLVWLSAFVRLDQRSWNPLVVVFAPGSFVFSLAGARSPQFHAGLNALFYRQTFSRFSRPGTWSSRSPIFRKKFFEFVGFPRFQNLIHIWRGRFPG